MSVPAAPVAVALAPDSHCHQPDSRHISSGQWRAGRCRCQGQLECCGARQWFCALPPSPPPPPHYRQLPINFARRRSRRPLVQLASVAAPPSSCAVFAANAERSARAGRLPGYSSRSLVRFNLDNGHARRAHSPGSVGPTIIASCHKLSPAAGAHLANGAGARASANKVASKFPPAVVPFGAAGENVNRNGNANLNNQNVSRSGAK